MLRALAELGLKLEAEGKLAPTGYSNYVEPVRWRIHIWPDRVYVEETELAMCRPSSGRTSGVEAHVLADEAGYAVGVDRDGKGTLDRRAPAKYAAFRALNQKLLSSPIITDASLREAVNWVEKALESDWVKADPRYRDMVTKDWVVFVPGAGPLRGMPLIDHPEVRQFWIAEMEERSSPSKGRKVWGECAICGQRRTLVGKMPGSKLVGISPLHSLNIDTFVSWHAGSGSSQKTHIGLCFPCSSLVARAFTYLRDHPMHFRSLVRDDEKRDSLTNQFAVYWLQTDDQRTAATLTISIEELLAAVPTVMDEGPRRRDDPPAATLEQLAALLKVPWAPREERLRLDQYAFYLGIVSPNVGRIAVREWFSVSIAALQRNLSSFLRGSQIVSSWGDTIQACSIATMLSAMGASDPNLTRGLLRTAYRGHPPPNGLMAHSLRRVRNPRVLSESREAWRLHALLSALKLSLYYGKEEAVSMQQLNTEHRGPAYLCGRLLAALEEAQLRAANFRLNRTLVDRFYGSATTAPASTFGGLLKLATTAHLGEVGRELNGLVENLLADLDGAGGFPRTLTLPEQADFALGFYHQRAAFRAGRKKSSDGGDQT